MSLPELFHLLISAKMLNYNFCRAKVSAQMVSRTDPKSYVMFCKITLKVVLVVLLNIMKHCV